MNSDPTIEQINEAIAMFMELTPRLVEYPNKQLNRMEVWRNNHSTPMEYHSSWDWLMPVVEKIESIYDDFHGYFGVHISSNSCCIQGTKLRTEPGREHYAYFNEVTHDTKLSATYNAVYLFIQWYRKQNNATNVIEVVFTDKERKLLTLFERIITLAKRGPEYRMTGYISQYGKAPDCPGANDSIFIEYNETEECIIDVAKTINLWDANWFISQWHDQYTLVKGDKEVKASISKRQAKELIVELDLMPEQSPVFRNGKTWKNQKENKQ